MISTYGKWKNLTGQMYQTIVHTIYYVVLQNMYNYNLISKKIYENDYSKTRIGK